MRERFDVLGQTLDASVPRLGLEFLVPCHVLGKLNDNFIKMIL